MVVPKGKTKRVTRRSRPSPSSRQCIDDGSAAPLDIYVHNYFLFDMLAKKLRLISCLKLTDFLNL